MVFDTLKRIAEYQGEPHPAVAGCWVRELGAAAPWLLTADTLRSALSDDWPALQQLRDHLSRFLDRLDRGEPVLSDTPGAANVLFVTKDIPSRRWIRKAFCFPLQWTKGQEHSPLLPKALLEEAARVRRSCKIDEIWKLQPGPDLGPSPGDWSTMSVACASGYAALAAGLLIAKGGGRVSPTTFLSAAWREEAPAGFRGVDGIRDKLDLARELGAKSFYCAAADAERLSDATGVIIQPLPFTADGPEAALKPLLARLQVPPELARDGLEACLAYANLPQGRAEREVFILREITQARAERLREGAPRCDRLVVLMSWPASVALSVLALRPKKLRVIHTPESSGMDELRRYWPSVFGADNVFTRIKNTRDEEGIRAAIGDLFRGAADGEALAVDVTGGTKGMTAVAALEAARLGASVLQIETATPERQQCGEEQFYVIGRHECGGSA